GAVSDDSCVPVSTTKTVEDVSIGIVPFTVMVNIGTQFKDATWLDWAGKSSVARINFDTQANRKDLFDTTGTTWAGCVEARKSPYDTTDEEPSTIPGKEDTLFVPMFVPDGVSPYLIKDRWGNVVNDAGSRGNYMDDIPPDSAKTCPIMTCRVDTKNGSSSYTLTIGTKVTYPKASCVPASDPVWISSTNSGKTNTYSLLSRKELQSRVCKYTGVSVSNSKTNAGCPSVPVLPMTEAPKLVLDKISDMVANGSTNIQQGAIWGVHALTHGEPLTQGRVRNDTDVRKALIIMTDGENDPPFYDSDFNGGDYFSWGFPYDGRLADTRDEVSTETKIRAIQDAKTIAACATAKALGMEVFTIGLSSPAGVKTMLTTCSSGANYAFFPNSPDQLIPTFRNIANQLAPLSITK
ncbi:MAG TPA: hypothetical protein VL147_19870, partial [Devosia sp.]|nr:hypothetical protein [Devosia sp.]